MSYTTDNLLDVPSSRREEWSDEDDDDVSQAENYEILVRDYPASVRLFHCLTS